MSPSVLPQAQPVYDLPGLVRVGKHLIMASEVAADEHDGDSWR